MAPTCRCDDWSSAPRPEGSARRAIDLHRRGAQGVRRGAGGRRRAGRLHSRCGGGARVPRRLAGGSNPHHPEGARPERRLGSRGGQHSQRRGAAEAADVEGRREHARARVDRRQRGNEPARRQVGDFVEYEYLLAHAPRGPTQPGFTASSFYFQIARQPNNWSTYVVTADKGTGMHVDPHNMQSPQPKVEGGEEVFAHEERRVAPYIPEPQGPPSGNEFLPFVSVGAGATGNEGLVAAYADAFLDKGQVTAEVESFARTASRGEGRARAGAGGLHRGDGQAVGPRPGPDGVGGILGCAGSRQSALAALQLAQVVGNRDAAGGDPHLHRGSGALSVPFRAAASVSLPARRREGRRGDEDHLVGSVGPLRAVRRAARGGFEQRRLPDA